MRLVINIEHADICIIQKGRDKEILCDREENDAITVPEPEPAPEPSKPYPIGSPEAQAAIERVKNQTTKYEPLPKKRGGRRKKEDNE